jgi:glucose/arabinose dehydrogenase
MTPRRRIPMALASGLIIVVTGCSRVGDTAVSPGPSVTFSTQPPTSTPATSAPTTAAATTSAPETIATSTTTTEPLGDPEVSLAMIGSFAEPVDAAWRLGDPTMFVVQRGGMVVPVRGGVAGAAALDIRTLTTSEGERGLLGLTFSSDGTLAYVNHTDRSGDTNIVEYRVGTDGAFVASSRRVLLTIEQPYANHNGGNVTIGPDGMLYIGMGDGGSGGDPERHSLNVTSLLGKILRIDPTPTADQPYTVPAGNPFVGVSGARPEIWSVGVRNPWRMSFDSETGDLWFGDVGQGEIEEIDVARAADGGGRGVNWGWSAFEGSQRFNTDQSADGATPPVFEYVHGDAGCSVSGGAVARDETFPALAGWYVFGDYCSGIITGLRVEGATVTNTLTLGKLDSVTAVRAAPDGSLYAISIAGPIAKIVPAG